VTDLPTGATAIPSRLGVTARFDDRGLVLDLAPGAEVLRHGVVRASVLAYMVDAGAGITVDGDETTWTFTTDLSVRMQARPAPPQVTATTVVLRQGRRSATLSVDLLAGDGGEVVAGGAIGFARVPRKPTDPLKPIVLPETAPERFRRFEPLTRPLREEAGVVVIDAAAGSRSSRSSPTCATRPARCRGPWWRCSPRRPPRTSPPRGRASRWSWSTSTCGTSRRPAPAPSAPRAARSATTPPTRSRCASSTSRPGG
jgi:acyl-coenzyme A thioesterase PaaI-like protein